MTISANIIADSISESGNRITTWELEYPRFIHAEFLTHRLFSRNAASSRAIPVKRSLELINENMAMPSFWGKNQPGMSAKEECNNIFTRTIVEFDEHGNLHEKLELLTREQLWRETGEAVISYAKMFDEAGYHKQTVNRLV
jgi:hypothetical protein